MEHLPEYVRHVQHTHADHPGKAWCGVRVVSEWAFMDVTHAAYSGLSESRVIVCPKCLSVIVKALSNGQEG